MENKLISCTQKVLQLSEEYLDGHIGFQLLCKQYANFKRQPLSLGQFIPCTPEGEVLEEPLADNYSVEDLDTGLFSNDYDKYTEAKARVIFENVEYEIKNDGDIQLSIKIDEYLTFDTSFDIRSGNFWDIWADSPRIFKTIEDLAPYQLTLTENAIKLFS